MALARVAMPFGSRDVVESIEDRDVQAMFLAFLNVERPPVWLAHDVLSVCA